MYNNENNNYNETPIITNIIPQEDTNSSNVSFANNNTINKKNTNITLYLYIIIIILITIATLLFLSCIEVKGENDLKYKENAKITYKVLLKENKYYKDTYQTAQQKYIASLIDKIDIKFHYDMIFNNNVDTKTNYYLESSIELTDNERTSKNIYEKKKKLVTKAINDTNSTKPVDINESVTIKYNDYTKTVESLMKDYHLNARGYLKIRLYTNTSIDYKNFANQKQDKSLIYITIPLSTDTVDITTDYNQINKSKVLSETQNTKLNNNLSFKLSIILYIISVILIVYILLNPNKIQNTSYKKTLHKILKEYDRFIVETETEYKTDNHNIIDVPSFEELLDVKENVEGPIVHKELDPTMSVFYIKENEDIYRFILKDNKK